jgi:Protein of unknown function (DUF3300)
MTLLRDNSAIMTGTWSRLAMTIVLVWTGAIYPAFAQTTQPTAPETAQITPAQPGADPAVSGYSLTDLEYLLGPIALYPDPLLALILPASAFYDQILEAQDWITSNPQAVERGDFTAVDAKPWDSSVQALTRFPDVIKLLSEHLDWTESLGWAYSVQPADVGNVIQLLRAKAESVGNLKSTSEQMVTTREEGGSRVIYIVPANPERIYVPVYDSSLVFGSALTGALVFGTAVLVGSTWNNRWGWNNRSWNQVWINPPGGWRPGRPGGRPPGAWRPDRPGVRPDRPGVRPDRPGMRPDRPGVRPDRPGVRPDRPSVRPDRPGVRPERPGARPERPNARPERPGARPERPSARPESPGTRPQRPAARPESRPTRPQQRPQAGNRQRPGNTQRPQGTRPQRQQTHRPQQRARSSQPHARPQGTRSHQPRPRSQPTARPQVRGRS